MTKERTVSSAELQRVRRFSAKALQQYEHWDLDEALDSLEEAIRLDPDEPELQMILAQVKARLGDFEGARRALGSYIRFEGDGELAQRFEQLLHEETDEVEVLVTRMMTDGGLAPEMVEAAVRMWLEYRICLGRRPLVIRKPETWASALDYTIRKINFREMTEREIAELYGVSPSTVHAYHHDLVQTLDIMPCDYRYFQGEENPLDRLAEAAAVLEELEERFRQP